MTKKIAIPVQNGTLCGHFGHCEQFYFADIENGLIVKEQFLTPPDHHSGVYPLWVEQNGANIVIAGGIGGKAKELLVKKQISVYAAKGTNNPRQLAEAYIGGALPLLETCCNHKHEDHNCNH